jgi:hypothetical protein
MADGGQRYRRANHSKLKKRSFSPIKKFTPFKNNRIFHIFSFYSIAALRKPLMALMLH